jgi:hypothetical protein
MWVVRYMFKNGQHKELFVSEIGLCVHNLIINLSSIVNKMERERERERWLSNGSNVCGL